MTEDIQSELERRNQEARDNEYLIGRTVQKIISDFLKRAFGENLSKKEKLMYTSSIMAIATEEIAWKMWVQGND